MYAKWTLLVFIGIAWWLTPSEAATSHYCYKQKSYTQAYRQYHGCYYRYYYYHYYWYRYYYWRNWWCVSRWIWRYRTVNYSTRECCSGWKGSRCDIPICNPSCGSRGVCLSPTEGCYCTNGLSGDDCATKTCSYAQDCWPGMCKGAGECTCTSGFEGDNCQEIRDGPIFNQCSATFIKEDDGNELVRFDQVCGKEGYANYTFYTSAQDFNYVSLTWDTFFHLPEDTPTKPRYLYKDVPGIINVSGSLKLIKGDNTTQYERRVVCNHPAHWSNPHLNAECRDVRELWNEPVKHRYRLEIALSGTSGGHKEIHDEGQADTFYLNYTGTTTTHWLHVYFDLEPPHHCSLDESCGKEEFLYPVFVNPDISKEEVQLVWSGWEDDDTGLDIFMYEIFKMELDQNNYLSELADPVHTGDWDDEKEKVPPKYTPSEPGMYSIILTVTDDAGNKMQARTLLLYDNIHNITTNPEEPLHIQNAHPDSGFTWIHNTGDNLKVSWEGLFANQFHVENHLLERVKKFDTDYDDVHGNRTLSAIPNRNGITMFEMVYTINSNEIDKIPETWENKSLETSADITVTRRDGDAIRVWVKAHDAMGNTEIQHTTIEVDTTPPLYVATNSRMVKNVDTKGKRPTFATRVELNMVDTHSGIEDIEYEIHEIITHNETNLINSGTEKGKRVSQTSQECAASGDCVCLVNGDCYHRHQDVYMDNCWFMGRDDGQFVLKFTAYNKARLQTSGEYMMGKLDGLRGQGEYPAVPKDSLRVKQETLTGESATVEWKHPSACYKVVSSIISYQLGDISKEHQVSAQNIPLDELTPNTEYQIDVVLVYEDGQKSSAQSLIFITLDSGPTGPGAHTGEGDSGSIGVIVGSIFGGLIVCLLIAVLIVLLVRKRQNKPMVPEPVKRTADRVKSRISMWHGGPSEPDLEGAAAPVLHKAAPSTGGQIAYPNPGYDPEEDLYIYGGMETDEEARWKFANDRIDIGKPVPDAKGRFADFRFARITTRSGQETVVAKMLKPTATEDDKMLMKAKMNFMGTALSFHPNVVNFIGALPEGPVLLLEYCNAGRLSDWLTNLNKVDEDAELNFSNFCIMAANGMAFLHEKNILHRRLGARNVLLKKDKLDNLIIKIAGFGPMTGEEAGTDASTMKDRVPIKYLAVEQMPRPKSGSRKYTKESDVWSLGILFWEIYSKGETPYPGMRSGEVADKVGNGYRMPKPNYCPDFVYSDIISECWYAKPAARPSALDVHTSLKHHFEGGGGNDLYYDDSEMAEMEEEFYSDTATAYPRKN